eukprot:scaffold108338_cov34-Attheya_sp.AAC.1
MFVGPIGRHLWGWRNSIGGWRWASIGHCWLGGGTHKFLSPGRFGGVAGGSANATLGGVTTLVEGGAIGVGLAFPWMGTLGSAAGGRGAIAVGTVGGEGEQSAVLAWANISASWKRAWRWLSTSGANGEAGPGWRRASMRSRTVAEASLVVDALGMET